MNVSEGVPSIGIAYLAGTAKAAGHDVVVVDAFGEAPYKATRLPGTNLLIHGITAEEIAERVPTDVDLIGVSCMYSNEWVYYREVLGRLAISHARIPVVIGGEHVTADPEYSLRQCPQVHCAVLGEGETTLANLIDDVTAGVPLDRSRVQGIAFVNSDGAFVKTEAQARIRSIDEIPLPSWDESPLENYLANGLGMAARRGRNMPMLASRGCPYQCTFCSNPNMWGLQWLPRDPRLVLDEMKHWIDKYRVTHIEFYDLTTIVKKSWIMEFTDLLLQENLGVTWALPSGTRSEALDAEVVDRLYRSGCRDLTYAPESGSPETLKRIKKKVHIPKMLASMTAAARHGIFIKANMILGFPGQTMKEVAESYWFMVRMAWAGVRDVAVFPFVPYPGSELFFQLVREGRIVKGGNYEAFLSGNVYNEVSGMTSWSEYISNRRLKFLTVGGMAWFYGFQFLFRPWRLMGSLRRLLANRPRTMMERLVDAKRAALWPSTT